MQGLVDRLLALPAQAVIELFGSGGPLSLGGAAVVLLSLLAYLTKPRVGYIEYASYGRHEFALLIVNMDAAPLGKPLRFPVHAEHVTRVRAFPCHERAPHVDASHAPSKIEITVHNMAEEDTLMLVFEHEQPQPMARFRVGGVATAPEFVVPRQWGPLPNLTLPRRVARAALRIIPGVIMFVGTYAILRGGFAYPPDVEARRYPIVSWDTAIITIGVIGCAVAYWMSSMDKGRKIAIPSEVHGVSWCSPRWPVLGGARDRTADAQRERATPP